VLGARSDLDHQAESEETDRRGEAGRHHPDRGLATGADIAKWFSVPALRARIDSLLRRARPERARWRKDAAPE
jgi:hypothetical protein